MSQRVLWLLALLLVVPAASAQNGTDEPATNQTAPNVHEPAIPVYFGDEIQRLPPAFQEGPGLFAVSLVAWAAIGLLVILVVAPLLKWVTARTPTHLDAKIIGIVSKPAFILVFTYGIVDSLAIFALPAWSLVTLDRIWRVVLVVVLVYVIYRVWHEIILEVGAKMSKKTETELDDKLFPLFDKVGGVIIILVGLWFIVDSFGVDMTIFVAGSAIGGLVIAFAAQDTLANFFAGVHILIDQPFREGDRIEIKEENTWGDVAQIGLRSTRIITRDNRMVIVPNAVIGSNPLINHTFPNLEYRLTSKVGVAYGTDLEHARRVLVETVRGVEGIHEDQSVQALFRAFGDSSLDFEVRYWISNYQDTRIIEDRVNTAINAALEKEGIEIPFPQRVLWNGAKPDADVVTQ